MVRVHHHVLIPGLSLAVLLASGVLPGCGIVPRSRMEESQKVSQLLRTENARLKDQVLSLQSQNRDLADRAVDDLRRLTAREQAIERLEQSVQAYQGDRERLAAAYEQLTTSLGRPLDSEREGAGRTRRDEPIPDRRKTPSPSGRPSPEGITSGDDEDRNRSTSPRQVD
jgi:hypothetical protein